MRMIAKAVKFSGTKGIMMKKNCYVELVLNAGTEQKPKLVYIYVNIKCGPDKILGKKIKVFLNKNSFIKSPVEDKKIIYSDKIEEIA